jgi:hypothetical protein
VKYDGCTDAQKGDAVTVKAGSTVLVDMGRAQFETLLN